MSIQSFKVTWPTDLIRGTDPHKVYARVIKFRGTDYKTEYEEIRDLSILICYLKENEKELLKHLVIAKFTRGVGDSHDQAYNILLNGIIFSDQPQRIYRYIGHSNSQMRDKDGKNCFLLPFQTDERVFDFMDRFADFYSIKTIEKRAKRIAQLFSSFYNYIELSLNECKLIKDVQNVTYIFTDGCGFMSSAFVNKIKDKLRLNHTPSVCQIRYQGFKGVLLHVPQLKEMVHFRDSMHKFRIDDALSSSLNYFGLIEWSKPYLSRVYLNKQIIMLLESIGVEERILKRLQSEFYETLENLTIKKHCALEYLSCIGDKKLIDSISDHSGINAETRKSLERMQKEEIDRLTKNSNAEKSRTRILLRNARCVFGVADPYGILKENECFFNPTLLPDDVKTFEKAEKVVVTRNPCYFPGDIRVLNLVQKHSLYDHLTDCIVFSVHGKRPIADTMSGGDLDGDKFSIIWDRVLFPKRINEPFIYKTSDEKQPVYEPNLVHENIISSSNVASSTRPVASSSISSVSSVRISDRQGLKVNQPAATKSSISNKVKLMFPIDLTCSCKAEFTKNMKNLDRKLTDHFEQLHCGTSLSYICSTCKKEFEQFVVVSSHYGQCKQETSDFTTAAAVSVQKPSSSVSTSSTINSSVLNNSIATSEITLQKLKLNYETSTAVVEFPVNFLCFCKQTFDSKGRNLDKTLAEHFQKAHSSYIFKFTCRGCKRVFDKYLDVSSHHSSCPKKNETPVTNKLPNDVVTSKPQSSAALNASKKSIEIKSTVTTTMPTASPKQQHQVLPLNSLPVTTNQIVGSEIFSSNESSFLESKQPEPKTNQKGASNVKQTNTKRPITQNAKVEFRKQLIDYFGKFDTSLVGQLDNLFMNFAAISGPECPECVELNKLLSLAIDMQITKQDAINQIKELQKKYKKIENENNNKTLPEIKFWSDMEKITDEFLKKFKK